MEGYVTVFVQVRTPAAGSGWQMPIQVAREAWDEMTEQQRMALAYRTAMHHVTVAYSAADEEGGA